ncbi:thioredoxin [Oscillospiraceae bacterium PP1C4]
MSVITLTKQNFSNEVLSSDKPVLVDFWAPWCAPCRMLSPIVEEVADEVSEKAKVGKVNIDEQPELAQQFGVMSIPTLVVLKAGKVIATSVGSKPKHAVLRMLEDA